MAEEAVALRDKNAAPKIADIDFGKAALRRMMFIRSFEQKCLDLSIANPPAIAGSVHLCAGQEAIPVGACAALSDDDKVIATYRGHGWAIESGLDPFAVLGEICHRDIGVNGGRGGSALIMDPSAKFVGENSIVGAGGPIACGVALGLKHKAKGGVILVSFGDGAMNQGALHEAFVFAVARKLPIVFVCENNGWSELTPTSRVVPFERLARRANAYGMQGITIDGCDPLVVRDTIELAVAEARTGKGPSLVECKTVRLWGHYNRDVEHYRPKQDRAEAERRDPVVTLAARLVEGQHLRETEIFAMRALVQSDVEQLAERVIASPEPDASSARDHVFATSRSATRENADSNGAPIEWTYQQAVNEALRAELSERPEVVVFGEDVGHAGGIFGCSRNLQREFGEERVFDTPIAEAAILGTAVGSALSGMRPIAEIMWMDFMLVALDQLINQAANVRYVTRGQVGAPLVVRVQQGATPGSCPQHSQSLEALLAHIPGLKVGLPATPQDAYDMLRAAVADPDPCVIIEARSLYQTKGVVMRTSTPVGTARLRRDGGDISIISWGPMVNVAAAAAARLDAAGIRAAVLDLRWLSPLDEPALLDVVRKSGERALIVHEANRTAGFGAEIMARLHENGLTSARLATPDVRIPAAPILQREVLPGEDAIVSRVKAMLS